MKRAINLEIYRLKKNKYPYIIIILSILMMSGSVFMTSSDYHYYLYNQDAFNNLKTTYEQVNWGIYAGSVIPNWVELESIPITELFMKNIQSKILLMFQTIFVVLFIGEEIRSKFLKNIIAAFPKNIDLILGKFIVIAVFTLFLFISNFLFMMLTFYLLEGYIVFTNLNYFLKYVLVEYLLYLSYSSLIMLLVYLIKNSAASLLIGILDASGILEIVDTIIHSSISNSNSFSIMNYIVTGRIVLLSINSSGIMYLHSIIIAIIFLIISITGTYLLFRNKDVC